MPAFRFPQLPQDSATSAELHAMFPQVVLTLAYRFEGLPRGFPAQEGCKYR